MLINLLGLQSAHKANKDFFTVETLSLSPQIYAILGVVSLYQDNFRTRQMRYQENVITCN